MQQHFAHLFPTPRGITLAGIIIAKRNQDKTFAIRGREKEIHAQLQAAYGKPISPSVLRYIRRGSELLAQVSDDALEAATYPYSTNPYAKPHSANDIPIMAKGLMLFALTGLNDMDKPEEGKARLEKMQRTLRQDALLKAYGLPTWEELTKDDSDDEDDEEEEGDDSGEDDSAGGDSVTPGSGNGRYNPDEPRIPAGQPGAGQWTSDGNSGSDTITTATTTPLAYTTTITSAEAQGNNNSTKAVPVTLDNGSVVNNPVTGKPILMPDNVSLQANVSFGESIKDLPSYLIGSPGDNDDLSSRETAMVAAFMPGGAMDYQRISSDLKDGDGSVLIDQRYIDFGNFNYGMVAAAAGYQLEQTVNIASAINARNIILNPKVDTSDFLGGNPRNNYFVRMGYYAYTSGKIAGTGK